MKSDPPKMPPPKMPQPKTLEHAVIQAAVMALTNYVRANYPYAGHCREQFRVATDPVEQATWRARSETWERALNDVVELQLYILRYFPEYHMPHPADLIPPLEPMGPRLVVNNTSRGADDGKG